MSWSKEQMANAITIYNVGIRMGMSSRDIQIGLITALTESGMRNLNYGDRDSLGIFQQRPSQGWGTVAQVTDPVYASQKFFSALKGLGDKRYGMSMGAAAQAVQRSAFPDRYASHLGEVRNSWPTLQGKAGASPKDPTGATYGTTPPTKQPLFYQPPAPPDPTVDIGGTLGANVNMALEAPGKDTLGAATSGMLGAPQMDSSGAQMRIPEAAQTFLGGPLTQQHLDQVKEQATGTPFEKGVNGWRKAVIQYAKSALGQPYTWGGTNLSSGVDCSGLIQAAFAKAGYNLPRISYQQANYGKRVNIGALRPGDLVAWDNSSRNNGADHIALYIGNGQIIEAARPGTAVRIRSLGKSEGAWGVHLNL